MANAAAAQVSFSWATKGTSRVAAATPSASRGLMPGFLSKARAEAPCRPTVDPAVACNTGAGFECPPDRTVQDPSTFFRGRTFAGTVRRYDHPVVGPRPEAAH